MSDHPALHREQDALASVAVVGVRPVTEQDVVAVLANVLDVYHQGVNTPCQVLRAASLAERADCMTVALRFPELSTFPASTGPQAALLEMVRQCADDVHASHWLHMQYRQLGLQVCVASQTAVAALEDARAALCPSSLTLADVANFRPHRHDYEWVSTRDLPAPHNPFKCGYKDAFEEFLAAEKQTSRRRRVSRLLRPWLQGAPAAEDDNAQRERAGERFREWLLTRPQPPCPWHEPPDDWLSVMEWTMSVWVWSDSDWTPASVAALIDQRVPRTLRKGVRSMFFDPIVWGRGSNWLGSGQHRSLALQRAGAPFALVVR